ncbi:MAG: menaquinone biosynthesis protein [bacterium]|nr:menaquinone biosynthesis protein [bacterium]
MKIGAIPFLNVKPLIYKLEACLAIDKSVELVYEYPSTLSGLLKSGQIDVGIIPTIDYFRGIGKFVIPKICISSYGKVASVKLFYKDTISSIKEVAVDKGSSTSVALLRIILSELYSISPLFKEITPVLPQVLEENEAVLLIGDQPLTTSGKSMDLGEEWYKLTQLPFVYAFWVIRDGLEDYEKIVNLIVESKEFGIRNLDEIVRNESERMSLNKELVSNYLKQIIGYDLRRLELKGILKFANLALKHKLIEKEREIEFCTTSNFRYGIKRREDRF